MASGRRESEAEWSESEELDGGEGEWVGCDGREVEGGERAGVKDVDRYPARCLVNGLHSLEKGRRAHLSSRGTYPHRPCSSR